MSFHSWLQNLRSALAPGRGQRHHRRRGSLRAATHRLNVEALEDRLTPSFTWNYPVWLRPGRDTAPSGPATADFNGDGWSGHGYAEPRRDPCQPAAEQRRRHVQRRRLPVANVRVQSWRPATSPATASPTCSSRLGRLAVLPGHGDGTFAAPIRILGNGDGSLAVADFNGDSQPDVCGVAVDDFDADGKLDLAVDGTSDSATMPVSSRCWVAGTEPSPPDGYIGVDHDTQSVVTVDLNRDGGGAWP